MVGAAPYSPGMQPRPARSISMLIAASVLTSGQMAVGAALPAAAATTYTFDFSGANQNSGTIQTWVVPADVSAIYVTARGGDGAGDTMPNSDPRKYGGHGAVVTMTTPVAVTPGATLSIYVAGRGDPGRGSNAAGKGGWGYGAGGQGGSGYAGGGGGGASAVVSDLDGLLIVAGGGGGAGAEIGADGGTAAYLGTAAGQAGLGTGGGGGGDAGVGGAAGAPGATGVLATAGQSFAAGGAGGTGAKNSTGSRSYPFGGGGGGGYGAGGGGGGESRSGATDGGAGGGAGGSFSAVSATFAPSTLPWNTGDLRVGNPGQIIITTYDPPPPPPVAPTAPMDVVAVAGNRTASVTWLAPAKQGTWPVTNYQVISSPSGGQCLTQGATSCDITGLTNGADYSFTVRALNGAGWGPWSASSDTVRPSPPPPAPSILISGMRGNVRGEPGVIVTGVTTGLELGGLLWPWVEFQDQPVAVQGLRQVFVDADGTFTWQRRTPKTVTVSMRSSDGAIASNSITIRS